jgi:hypothetical protein
MGESVGKGVILGESCPGYLKDLAKSVQKLDKTLNSFYNLSIS